MTSTQSCLKTVEVEQLVDRLTRCDSLHGIVPNVPNDRLNEGGLHYLYAGARANVHLAWLVASEFPFNYLEGFVGNAFASKLAKNRNWTPQMDGFNSFFTIQVGRSSFCFFFLVVVCGVKPMPSQPSFHLRFPLRPWGVG